MNYISKYFLLAAVLVTGLWSCEKDENKIFFEGGTPPVLTASVSAIPMSFTTRDEEAVIFSWTNPDYRFTTGVSSQDVNYQLEIDRAGANFASASKQTVAIKSDLQLRLTQTQLNDYLLNQLILTPDTPADIEVRLKANLGANAVTLLSNVLRFSVTPYSIPPKVAPPSSGTLYITGSATPASWQCACGEPELLSQKFNQISPTVYELPSITLTGGGSYLFLPVYGSWSAKYGYVGANNANNVDGDDFKAGGGDMLAPPTTGNYKITVDFQRGKFTVTKL